MLSAGPEAKVTRSQSAGSRICAIVVSYRPGPEVPVHIGAILRQVSRVVVVDNEASASSRTLLSVFAENPVVELVENQENLGIAAALNQGVELALAEGFDWVATFDQDSHVPEGYFGAMLDAYSAYPDRDNVAVLAPIYRDIYLGFIYSSAGPALAALTGDELIQVTAASGNLVSTTALRAVGGFREDFFIDCVDFEFCLRCRKAGWLVLEVRRVILDHAMGHYRQIRWLWRSPRINDYDATRRYYQARNLLILYANFGHFDLHWMVRNAWFYGRDLIKLMLFCENRRKKLGAVFTGWWHAVTGRRGRWRPGAG